MRVHHLNCGSLCPTGGRLINGDGPWLGAAHMCCHCLLIEGHHGLILVDTGLGTRDVAHPRRLGALFNQIAQPRLQMSETALHQVRELGFDPCDVQHILLTHLGLDHAGGMADFPQAQVHVYAKELQAALKRSSWLAQQRYRPSQWGRDPKWFVHDTATERWFGFDAIKVLPEMDNDVLLVPLVGHTAGHCGVAVRTDEGWLLHCGDAYFYRGEIDVDPSCPIGLKFFQWLLAMDHTNRLISQQRLRELKYFYGDLIAITCAHDPVELRLLASAAEYRARQQDTRTAA